MTPQQALQNLYTAARAVNANADTHEGLQQSYELMAKLLSENNKPAQKVK